MKFGKYLVDNATPEWASCYVDYRALKKAIKRCVVGVSRAAGLPDEDERIEEQLHEFSEFVGAQIARFVGFFEDKLSKLATSSHVLRSQCAELVQREAKEAGIDAQALEERLASLTRATGGATAEAMALAAAATGGGAGAAGARRPPSDVSDSAGSLSLSSTLRERLQSRAHVAVARDADAQQQQQQPTPPPPPPPQQQQQQPQQRSTSDAEVAPVARVEIANARRESVGQLRQLRARMMEMQQPPAGVGDSSSQHQQQEQQQQQAQTSAATAPTGATSASAQLSGLAMSQAPRERPPPLSRSVSERVGGARSQARSGAAAAAAAPADAHDRSEGAGQQETAQSLSWSTGTPSAARARALMSMRARTASVGPQSRMNQAVLSENTRRAIAALDRAVVTLYHELQLLHNFAVNNHTAIVKICKKFAKKTGMKVGDEDELLTASNVGSHPLLTRLIVETEELYSSVFHHGVRKSAMNKLREAPPQATACVTMLAGIFIGISIPLVIAAGVLMVETPGFFQTWPSLMSAFRGVSAAAIIVYWWALDFRVWYSSHVNHGFILQLDVQIMRSSSGALLGATIVTVSWALFLFLFLRSTIGNTLLWSIPAFVYPLVLAVVLFLFVFTPRLPMWPMRRWLLVTLSRVVRAPFVKVSFRDVFIGDQLTSLTLLWYDLEFTLCYFAYDNWAGTSACTTANPYVRPVLAVLPQLLRFLQCLRRFRDTRDRRQLWNAGKYSTSFVVVSLAALSASFSEEFGVMRICWLVAAVLSTVYTYVWDVTQDWSLTVCSRGKGVLGRRITYAPAVYYLVIVLDLVLRCAWVITFGFPFFGTSVHPEFVTWGASSLEICRRGMWNIFRVENEHFTNVGRFRAVEEVPLPFNVTTVPVSASASNGFGVGTITSAMLARLADGRSAEISRRAPMARSRSQTVELGAIGTSTASAPTQLAVPSVVAKTPAASPALAAAAAPTHQSAGSASWSAESATRARDDLASDATVRTAPQTMTQATSLEMVLPVVSVPRSSRRPVPSASRPSSGAHRSDRSDRSDARARPEFRKSGGHGEARPMLSGDVSSDDARSSADGRDMV